MTAEPVRLFLPVNWRNALEFYAHGLVLPRENMAKYHSDLLGVTPRRLPLVADQISGSVTEICVSSAADFPVALEIDGELSVQGQELDLDGLRVAVAPTGVIPVSHVSRIHVRSERDRQEFQVRRYRNIDTGRLSVSVSGSLFGEDGVEAERLVTWLRDLPDPGPLKRRNIIERQCIAGSLMLLSAAFSHRVGIRESTGKLVAKLVDRVQARDLLRVLPEGLADLGWVGRGDDQAMCAVAAETLAEMNGPEPPVASEVIERMRRLLADRELSDADLVSAHLDHVGAIDRGESAFTQFRRRGGLRAAKGLLLFLLRPDPTAVTTWLEEDINAEAEVAALAAVFSGISYGSTGLPAELRGSYELQHLLYDWIATSVEGSDLGIPARCFSNDIRFSLYAAKSGSIEQKAQP